MSPRVLLAMLYCGAAFGGSFLFMRIAAPDLPAFIVAFWRVGVATLALLLVAGRPAALRAIAAEWRGFTVVGFFMVAAPLALFAYAEQSITAGLGAILNATTPLWTVLIVSIADRRVPAIARIAAVAIGFAGVGVIVGSEGLHVDDAARGGVLAAALAASSYGIALTYARRRMGDHPPIRMALGQLLAGCVLLAPGALLSLGDAHPQVDSAVAVTAMGLLSTAIAWPLLFRLNRTVGPLATSTITLLNPIFGVLWGALFLGEVVSPSLFAGGLLVAVSLALILGLRVPARFRRVPRAADA